MMHCSPIVSPLDLVDKLGPGEKVGYKTLTTEQLKAYLRHLEENYYNLDPTPEVTPPNKWSGYARAVVQAMQQNFMVTKDDYDFLLVNSGYLFHQIIAEHMADLRSRFSVVSIDFESQELFGSQNYHLDQECIQCRVGHQRVGLPTECNATYGPYNSELLVNTTMPLDSFLAMVVGTKSLLTLHEAAWGTFLNVGITNQGELSLQTDRMGLANAVRKRIYLLERNSVLPILVEFYHDKRSPCSDRSQLFLAIYSLAQLQREYSGPIVLLIPPYCIDRNDGITEYRAKKVNHRKLEVAGSLLGKKLGLAVCSLVIQSEHRDMGTVMNHPQWAIEPLFNHAKVCTREYYRRVHDLMICLVNSLLPWIVPESQRLSCLKFQSEVNDHSENMWSDTHPNWLSGDRV
jgi:hypothetical protein